MTPEATFSESISLGIHLIPPGTHTAASARSVPQKQIPTAQRLRTFLGGFLSQVTTLKTGDLAAILKDLNALEASGESDEEGFIFKPEPHASNKAMTYILKAYRVPSFSRPKVEPDGEGGIVLDWRRNDKIIRLALRAKPNQRDYIYYQSDRDHTARPASLPFLLNRLQWLTKDE